MVDLIASLQKQLAEIEQRFEPLRKNRLYNSPEWSQAEEAAKAVRKQLWDLTGDAYGRPKSTRPKKPDDELLGARYDSPEDVPVEVMAWVRKHSPLITSDASDAVRWARIIDSQGDDRYPEGDLTLYRAIGRGDEMISEIRPGDWVTTSLEYAQEHLSRWLDGKGELLELTVDGCDVLVSPTGNHEEAIFAPVELSGPVERESNSADRGAGMDGRVSTR